MHPAQAGLAEHRSIPVFCTAMPPNARRRLGVHPPLAWMVVVAWMGVIFVLSSQPGLDTGLGRIGFGISKVGHVVVFSTLGFLTAHAMDVSGVRYRVWWTVVLVALYAIFDELHQAFVPGRDPMLTDVGIDTVSGWIAAIGWGRVARPFLARRRWRPRRERRERRAAKHDAAEVKLPTAGPASSGVGGTRGDEATG